VELSPHDLRNHRRAFNQSTESVSNECQRRQYSRGLGAEIPRPEGFMAITWFICETYGPKEGGVSDVKVGYFV
jgi:hypothetical protein